ncbi:hypothetical protein QEN19_004179 [Hanseniaspora menglaensis]
MNIDAKKRLLIANLVDVIRRFYQKNDENIELYLNKLITAVDIEDDNFRTELVKAYLYYSKYLIKNQKILGNFAVKYYDNSKKIIKLDFFKGYYSLFVTNNCILHNNDMNKNDEYMSKLYKKFNMIFEKTYLPSTSLEKAKIVEKIKKSYDDYLSFRTTLEARSKNRAYINPLKRDLLLEDTPRIIKQQCKNKDSKSYKTPLFLEKLPMELNINIFSFLDCKDMMNLLCLNSFTNTLLLDNYFDKIDQFFREISISNFDSLSGLLKIMPIIKKRKKPVKKLTFNLNFITEKKQKDYISIKQIQNIIKNIKIESLVIHNKQWTILDIIPLNLSLLKSMEVRISNVINDKQSLEDIFILNTCSNLTNLKIVYDDIVALKSQLSIDASKKNYGLTLYDNSSLIIGTPESKLKTLSILNNVVLSRYEKLFNYYQKKYIDLNISFSKLDKLQKLTLQNLNLKNQSQFWLLIKQNMSILTLLELFKIHNLPNIITLFYKLKDLKNLETFSLQESSAVKIINFTTINSQRVISNIYNTNNIPSDLLSKFLERYMILPNWKNLRNLTLINTNINKSLLLGLLHVKIKYLNISNNHNLLCSSVLSSAVNNQNSSQYISDFNFLRTLTPQLEVLVVAKLHYDTLISPFDYPYFINKPELINVSSILETLFWTKLRLLDISFNGLKQSSWKAICNIATERGLNINVDTLVAVGNNLMEEKTFETILDSGVCNNLVDKFSNDRAMSQYDCWFEKCVLDKYEL